MKYYKRSLTQDIWSYMKNQQVPDSNLGFDKLCRRLES